MDARYCGSGCRARASVYRRSPQGVAEREAREADPEYQRQVRMYRRLLALDDKPADQARLTRVTAAIRTGEACAECGRPLGEVIFWRKAKTGRVTQEDGRAECRSAPVCPGCCCPRPAWHEITHMQRCERCEPAGGFWVWSGPGGHSFKMRRWRCRDAGADHRGPFCEECHPARWRTGRCPGCERTVMFRHGVERRRWRSDPAQPWVFREVPDGQPLPAYCSTRCRDRVTRAEAAARRAAERSPVLCAHCGEVMDGQRADARYCSAACRQAAWRQRAAARAGP